MPPVGARPDRGIRGTVLSHLADPQFLTPKTRAAALRTAADVLFARQPCHQAHCLVWVGLNRIDAYAEWRWPGVVRVTLRHTGELLAQSEPGRPYDMALNSHSAWAPQQAGSDTTQDPA